MDLEEFDHFICPYCCQSNQLIVDITGGSNQQLIVDCEVCCAPIVVRIKLRGQRIQMIEVKRENE